MTEGRPKTELEAEPSVGGQTKCGRPSCWVLLQRVEAQRPSISPFPLHVAFPWEIRSDCVHTGNRSAAHSLPLNTCASSQVQWQNAHHLLTLYRPVLQLPVKHPIHWQRWCSIFFFFPKVLFNLWFFYSLRRLPTQISILTLWQLKSALSADPNMQQEFQIRLSDRELGSLLWPSLAFLDILCPGNTTSWRVMLWIPTVRLISAVHMNLQSGVPEAHSHPQPGPRITTCPPILVLKIAKLIRSAYYSSSICKYATSVSLYIYISLCISSCLSHRHCSCNRVLCNPCWRTSLQALQKLLSQDEGISGVKTVRDTFNLHPRSIHLGNNISTSRTNQKCD